MPACLLMSMTGAFTKAPDIIATTPAHQDQILLKNQEPLYRYYRLVDVFNSSKNSLHEKEEAYDPTFKPEGIISKNFRLGSFPLTKGKPTFGAFSRENAPTIKAQSFSFPCFSAHDCKSGEVVEASHEESRIGGLECRLVWDLDVTKV